MLIISKVLNKFSKNHTLELFIWTNFNEPLKKKRFETGHVVCSVVTIYNTTLFGGQTNFYNAKLMVVEITMSIGFRTIK